MRAIPVSTQAFLLPQPHSSLFFSHLPFHFTPSPKPCSLNSNSKITTFLHRASKPNTATLNADDENSGNLLVTEDVEIEESQSLIEDGVYIEVTKLEKNSRRIESRISIDASLDSIWNILTDYERLADFIPGLALSKLIQKGPNFARLLQVKCNWGLKSFFFLFIYLLILLLVFRITYVSILFC